MDLMVKVREDCDQWFFFILDVRELKRERKNEYKVKVMIFVKGCILCNCIKKCFKNLGFSGFLDIIS